MEIGNPPVDQIHDLFDRGWRIKLTRLSDEFTYEQFVEQHGKEHHLFFVVDGSKLQIMESGKKPSPRPGQLLVSLVRGKPTEVGE